MNLIYIYNKIIDWVMGSLPLGIGKAYKIEQLIENNLQNVFDTNKLATTYLNLQDLGMIDKMPDILGLLMTVGWLFTIGLLFCYRAWYMNKEQYSFWFNSLVGMILTQMVYFNVKILSLAMTVYAVTIMGQEAVILKEINDLI